MAKTLLFILLVFGCLHSSAQDNILLLKKKGRTIKTYYTGSIINFRVSDGSWMEGIITSMRRDSFDFTKTVVHSTMFGFDTSHFSGYRYAYSDLVEMPKPGVRLHYVNGQYEIQTSAGHQHFYWVKSGWIFRVGAAGYLALDAVNGLIHNNYGFKGGKVGIAAGVFLFGLLLKHTYHVSFKLGKKYKLEMMSLAR